MGSPVMQFQILSRDPDAAAGFYGSLFGWSVSTANGLGYRELETGSEAGIKGGIWPIPAEAPSGVSLYVQVEDVTAAVDHATALGASVVIPPQELPDGDAMAVIVDPQGLTFGLFRPRAAA
jgi:predicted enzyme related to lactoylglutathione lyase